MRRDEWPSVPTPPVEPRLHPLPAPEVAGEGSQDEVTRAPGIADDGHEFPPVKQLGAKPLCGGARRMVTSGMERWVRRVPTEGTGTPECATRILRDDEPAVLAVIFTPALSTLGRGAGVGTTEG